MVDGPVEGIEDDIGVESVQVTLMSPKHAAALPHFT
jgi:hypothetical protein